MPPQTITLLQLHNFRLSGIQPHKFNLIPKFFFQPIHDGCKFISRGSVIGVEEQKSRPRNFRQGLRIRLSLGGTTTNNQQ